MDKQILVDKYNDLQKEIEDLQQIRIILKEVKKDDKKVKIIHEKICELIDEQAKLLENLEWKK